ncbi:Uncharacterized protein OBRU01_19388 [Operophtera brumata]|uniref:SCY1-like protein 2 n=1 Tax=Operophtera brumata TaxID=104452 RepID=A0A0L7KX69_OPEBR|nr:Uncharacterized protein OBRU01_19388 [Operophtera brumata]
MIKSVLAPEVQTSSQINVLSDMFSFGMIIFAFYNNGKALFDANDNPMLYLKQLETLTVSVDIFQASAVECLMRCMEWLDDDIVLNQALPHVRPVLERHYNDLKMSLTVLKLFEMIMGKLDKQHLVVHVVPSILIMKLNEPTVMERFVSLYKRMVTDERLGIPHELMATKMLPSVAPHMVNKKMDQAQLTGVMEMLHHMLKYIERKQRIAIEEYKNRPPSPPKNLASRQISIDEPAPAFCIPNLKVQRKVSSAEEMARKNSEAAAQSSISATSVTGNIRRISQWFFGSNNSTNSNNMNNGPGVSGVAAATSGNFLRVANLLPGRRLSDNTLMAPKIKIAPSCASSPGGTPGGSQATLPTRRHSSIGPQERRPSHVNLSPPAVSAKTPYPYSL